MRLMERIRTSIKNECFPEFIRKFVLNYYSSNQKEKIVTETNKNSKENCSESKESELKESESESNTKKIPEWVINALKSVNVDLSQE
jgi:hypothetical protein